jgi:pimeloyl-ACP methyl ester carboxylesterase
MRIVALVIALLICGCVQMQGPPSDGYFTTSDQIKIHYLTLGDRGSWVVLIHGYTASANGNWFTNGVAQRLARSHRVVAIDCRNHGLSDKPTPRGRGIARDVVELLDHLKIERAHLHGYSMGGSITAALMAQIPERIITASFGGSGVRETDPERAAQAAALDTPAPGGRGLARVGAAGRVPDGPSVDLTKIDFPVIAIIGEYDAPNARTTRMTRELKDFKLTVLPGKNHLSAISAGSMPPEYIDTLEAFIESNDRR